MYKKFLEALTLPVRFLLVVVTYLILLLYTSLGERYITHVCKEKCCDKPFIIRSVIKPCWDINPQRKKKKDS